MEDSDFYKSWPPGHYYSPIPNYDEIVKNENIIFNTQIKEINGVDLNVEGQLLLLKALKKYSDSIPFTDDKNEKYRYFFKNDFYSHGDGSVLFCMIRHVKPKKIIEIGSGFSSCIILDTNEYFFNNSISCTFIEPYPERLLSRLKDKDKLNINLLQTNLQDIINLNIFSELAEGDILFIDSSHVLKVASDVDFIFSTILPMLNKGVHIHFHDIFYPFQYPKEWIFDGRWWNEAYFLKAFLQFNSHFKIDFFSTYLQSFYKNEMVDSLPLCETSATGNIWIKKIQ